MSDDYEVIELDLYQECTDTLDCDTQTNMSNEKATKAYEHANQWTTVYPNSYS